MPVVFAKLILVFSAGIDTFKLKAKIFKAEVAKLIYSGY